jgi:hypothetical protein
MSLTVAGGGGFNAAVLLASGQHANGDHITFRPNGRAGGLIAVLEP